MNSLARLGATMTIWIAFAAVTATLIQERTGYGGSRISEATLLLVTALIAYAAVKGTQAVWQQESEPIRRQLPLNMAKAKHGNHDRVARLVEALEEDELYDLEALLLARENDTQRFGRRS
ncbi:MAG: hypothetical protein JW966_08125 [Anaerolineae bacterium]|nr:hypothetical protein [Anaerolineae bacterium]